MQLTTEEISEGLSNLVEEPISENDPRKFPQCWGSTEEIPSFSQQMGNFPYFQYMQLAAPAPRKFPHLQYVQQPAPPIEEISSVFLCGNILTFNMCS